MKPRKSMPPAARRRSTGQRFHDSKKLAAYTATIGTLCAVPQMCLADVTEYVPPGGIATISTSDPSFELNFDGDSLTDFWLIWDVYAGGNGFFTIDGGEINQIDSIGDAVDVIPAGGTIPSDFAPRNYSDFSAFIGNRGYAAVRFSLASDPFTASQYGYLDVEVNADNDLLTIYGGAWESTPNAPIITPSGVPEPGSLAALAFGGLAAASRRRRKKETCG